MRIDHGRSELFWFPCKAQASFKKLSQSMAKKKKFFDICFQGFFIVVVVVDVFVVVIVVIVVVVTSNCLNWFFTLLFSRRFLLTVTGDWGIKGLGGLLFLMDWLILGSHCGRKLELTAFLTSGSFEGNKFFLPRVENLYPVWCLRRRSWFSNVSRSEVGFKIGALKLVRMLCTLLPGSAISWE